MNTYFVDADMHEYKAVLVSCSFNFEAESDEAAFLKADEIQAFEGIAPHLAKNLDPHFFANNLYRIEYDEEGREQKVKLER
jgi:hypothetical protein